MQVYISEADEKSRSKLGIIIIIIIIIIINWRQRESI